MCAKPLEGDDFSRCPEDDSRTIQFNNELVLIEQSVASNNLSQLSEGLELLFSKLQYYVQSADVLGSEIPLFGDTLGLSQDQSFSFFSRLGAAIRNALDSLQSQGQITDAQIASELTQVLRNQGAISATDEVAILTSTDEESKFKIGINREFTTNVDLASNLGLPGLGLLLAGRSELGFDYQTDLTFGVDTTGFFYEVNPNSNEINITLDVALPGLSAVGSLGLLDLQVVDKSADPSSIKGFFGLDFQDNDGKVRLEELASPSFRATRDGTSDINLDFTSSISGDSSFPSLTGDLSIDWGLNPGSLPTVAFNDIELDFGEFLTGFARPVFNTLSTALQPITDIVGFLTTLIDLGIIQFDLLDIIKTGYPSLDVSFIRSLDALLDFAGSLPTSSSAVIPLGSFDFGTLDLRNSINLSVLSLESLLASSTKELFSKEVILQEVGSAVNDTVFVDSLGSDSEAIGLEIPLLTDASQALRLLLGQEATLFTYEPPKFEFDIGYSQPIPIVGPLGFNLEASFEADIGLKFGFDSYGLTNPDADFFDGFYIDRATALSLSAELFWAAVANIGIASAGGGAFLRGGVGFGLTDNVRFSEIEELLEKPEDIFTANGLIEGHLEKSETHLIRV